MPSHHLGNLANFPDQHLNGHISNDDLNPDPAVIALSERFQAHVLSCCPRADFSVSLNRTEHALLLAHPSAAHDALLPMPACTALDLSALPSAVVCDTFLLTVMRRLHLKIANLESVSFGGNVWITDEGMRDVLVQADRLRELDVSHCIQLSDRSVSCLDQPLQKLDLTCCYDVSDAVLHSVIRHCRASLEELSLAGCTNLTDRTLGTLLNELTGLRKLNIEGCSSVSSKGFVLRSIRCRRMTEFSCAGCIDVDDDAILRVFEACPALRVCKLAGLRLVTDKSMCALPDCVLDLDVSGCFMLSAAWLDTLLQRHPLKRLTCVGCVRLPRTKLQRLKGTVVKDIKEDGQVVELDSGLVFTSGDIARNGYRLLLVFCMVAGFTVASARLGVLSVGQAYQVSFALVAGGMGYCAVGLMMTVLSSGM